jgi:four helix bundle protein
LAFLQHSSGSAWELEYHLLLAKDLEYFTASKHSKLERKLSQMKRMLSALMAKVEEAKD